MSPELLPELLTRNYSPGITLGGIISLESHGFLLPSHNTLVRFRSDMGGIVIFKISWKAALITESDLDLRSLV